MKPFSVALAVVAIAVVGIACGGGGDGGDGDSAADAVIRQFEYLDKGQWGRQWDELHPAQQEFIPRELYIQCAADTMSGIEITVNEVVETYEEDITIPGTDLTVPSTAVTVETEISQGLSEDTSTETYHEVMVDGEWRWLLGDPDEFKRGECP